MLLSMAFIFVLGFILSALFQKIRLPGLLGMMIAGMVLGPYGLNLLSQDLLNISNDLRKIALIIILIRAGLSLDIHDLKVVGLPAFLMSFIPATFEILVFTFLSPFFFNMTYLEGAILGTVIAAVSPAVIVPRMLTMLEKNQGTSKKIPQLIMASASVDDIFVITLFTGFMATAQGKAMAIPIGLQVVISIVSAITVGILSGYLLGHLFKKFKRRESIQVLLLLSLSFILVALEKYYLISGLLAIMIMAMTYLKKDPKGAYLLKSKFSNLWVGGELMLFALVGAAVPLASLKTIGFTGFIIITLALVARIIGVAISLRPTLFNKKEKLFCIFAFMPKATVQAALAPLPLVAGLAIGQTVLSLGVLSIFLTAPIGAILIDRLKEKFLDKDPY